MGVCYFTGTAVHTAGADTTYRHISMHRISQHIITAFRFTSQNYMLLLSAVELIRRFMWAIYRVRHVPISPLQSSEFPLNPLHILFLFRYQYVFRVSIRSYFGYICIIYTVKLQSLTVLCHLFLLSHPPSLHLKKVNDCFTYHRFDSRICTSF